MSAGWIAISDAKGGTFDPFGIGQGTLAKPIRSEAAVDRGFLARGSLLIEARLLPEDRPRTLLAYERTHPWQARIALSAIPGGGLSLVLSQGDRVFHTALNHNATQRTDTVRATFSWDAPRRWGRLSIERPEDDRVVSQELHDFPPLSYDDIQAMTCNPHMRVLDRDVAFFAVSDRIEPVGPAPTIGPSVPVLSSDGYRLAGTLKRGDVVSTMETGLVPVLQVVERQVPAKGSFRPVRLRAPYFGLRQDIVVSPDQRLVIGGSEVEYMFGREAVLLPVRHLVNGVSALYHEGGPVTSYSQLILPRHEPVFAAGCPIESLYIGRLRRNKTALSASLLAGFDRARLPEHGRMAYPKLKPYESVTLVDRRAA